MNAPQHHSAPPDVVFRVRPAVFGASALSWLVLIILALLMSGQLT
ncbi:hypothetical protein [Baekduia soli]|nr:hypothetical protein [Baekduia soli]